MLPSLIPALVLILPTVACLGFLGNFTSLAAQELAVETKANAVNFTERLLTDSQEGRLSYQQAAAIYASLYVREKIPFAQRQVFRVQTTHPPMTSSVEPSVRIGLKDLPEFWQEEVAKAKRESTLIASTIHLDDRWQKVRDRALLAQRLNRGSQLIQTSHFLIEADVAASAIPEIVFHCELTYSLLDTLFELPEPTRPMWVRVVKSRGAYLKMLKREVDQIGLTNGYFDTMTENVFCYWSDENNSIDSLRHELTHQILTRLWGQGAVIDWSVQTDFWAFEAIATYVESLVLRPGIEEQCCMLGGWESPRLQAARYRRLHDLAWIPFEQLRSSTRDAYQTPEDIQLRYSQSAGLAHYFMDTSAETRQAFSQYVRSVHRGTPDVSLLSVVQDDDIRKAYDAYLQADRHAFQTYGLQPARKDLVFSRTSVQSDDLAIFPSSHRNLDWFDLSYTEIDGSWLSNNSPWQVKRLNLESTQIADKDARAIANLQTLIELDLSNCDFSDAGVRDLTKLTRLETLWLTGTKISNNSANDLRQIPTLKSVEVSNTSTTLETFRAWRLIAH